MVANAIRSSSSSRRPTGIPRFHQQESEQQNPSSRKKTTAAAANAFKFPTTLNIHADNSNTAAAAATQQQEQHQQHQKSKKECVLSKQRKFESLMADMVAKQTITNKNNMTSSKAIFRDAPNHNTQQTFLYAPKTDQEQEQQLSSSSFWGDNHFPASPVFPSGVSLRRTKSHESGRTDGSPFARLMDTSVTNNNNNNNNSPTPPRMTSPYTDLQYSMLGLMGSDNRRIELDTSPMPKRRRAHDTYDCLQSLRQKARRNLEKLDVSSRTMSFDTPQQQEQPEEQDTHVGNDGDPGLLLAQQPQRRAQDYILGSCSSLIKEKRKQMLQEEEQQQHQKRPQTTATTTGMKDKPDPTAVATSVRSRLAHLTNPSPIMPMSEQYTPVVSNSLAESASSSSSHAGSSRKLTTAGRDASLKDSPSGGKRGLSWEDKKPPSSPAASGKANNGRGDTIVNNNMKPPRGKRSSILVETVEESSKSGSGYENSSHHGDSITKGRSILRDDYKIMGSHHHQEEREDRPSRKYQRTTTSHSSQRDRPATTPRSRTQRQLEVSSPPSGSYRKNKGRSSSSWREEKSQYGEPVVIRIYDSEVEEEDIRSRPQSRSHSRQRSRKNKTPNMFGDIRNDVDERIWKLKSKLGSRQASMMHSHSSQRKSTFVQDMKRGKNLKESLRLLRKNAKNALREERSRRHPDEEIVFSEDTKKDGKGNRRGGVKSGRTTPRTTRHKIIHAPILSPITVDAALADAQSRGTSYTSTRSDLMTKVTTREDFVGAEIHCSDDSMMTDCFATMSVIEQDAPTREAEETAEGTIKSLFSRAAATDPLGHVLSPCTRRKHSLTARHQVASSIKQHSVASSARREDPPLSGFPKQISHLFQTVGNRFVPSVPSGLLAMSKPDQAPSTPKWAIRKEHNFANDIKNMTESMGLRLGADPPVSSEDMLEMKLRSMEERMQAEIVEDSTHGENKTAMERYKKDEYGHETKLKEPNYNGDDFEFSELKKQLSDLSDAFESRVEGEEGICPSYCLPKKEGKPATISEIVSSSPIISKFLRRNQEGTQQPMSSSDNRNSDERVRSPASFTWDSRKNRSFAVDTQMSPLTNPLGLQMEGDHNATNFGAKRASIKGEQFFSQASPADDAESLSSELQKKKKLFGRLVSPLTLPSVKLHPGKAMLPPKAPQAPKMKRGSKFFGTGSKESPFIENLLQKPPRNLKGPQNFPGGRQHQPYQTSPWSQSGRSSISSKRPRGPVEECLSSLGESTQTDSFASSFMTSVIVRDPILEKMSSVSESEETSQYQEETSESSSTPLPSVESRKLDPPSIRRMDPSPIGGEPECYEQVHSEMSYSVDSKAESSTKESHFGAAHHRLEPEASKGDYRGNPLKRLLSRPRVPHRKPSPENSVRSRMSDESSGMTPLLDGEDLAEQYGRLQLHPGKFDPRTPAAYERALMTQEDAFGNELVRLQSWIGNCAGVPPACAPKSAVAVAPETLASAGGADDNVDNLVLASWDIKNRMDQLRASLTFSPGQSFARTSATAGATAATKVNNNNTTNAGADNDLLEDNGAVSSVSESSTYSTYGDDMAEFSHGSMSEARNIGNNHTMETDGAYFRGSRAHRPETPQTMRAFRSKSWKLDEDEDKNSLVDSELSAVSKLSGSENGTLSGYS